MRRFLLWIGRLFVISLAIGLVGGYFFANRYYNDEALAKRISEGFNKTHRGRLEIRRIHWKSSAIMALVKQSYDEVEVVDLRIFDSRGTLVVHVPRATGRIRLWDIILRGNFFIERLTFTQAKVRLERYERPDGPDARGDPEEIGLVGAFEKRPETEEERRKKKATGPPKRSFIVVDRFEASGIEVFAALGENQLTLEDLRVGGRLRFASAAGDVPHELSFDLRPTAPRGEVRLGDSRFALSELAVRRLATSPELARGLVLDAGVGVDLARLSVRGGVNGLGDGATLAVTADARGFGGVLAKLTGRAVRDEGSRLTAELSGPVSALVGNLRLEGIGLDEEPVQARDVKLLAGYEGGVLTVQNLSAAVLGGRLVARGTLHQGSGRWQATASAQQLSTLALLPSEREDLRGRVSGWVDAAGVLDDLSQGWTRFDLRLDRESTLGPLPPSVRAQGDLHGSKERLDIRRLVVDSNLFSVDTRGRFWPRTQEMDLALSAEARRLRGFLLKLGKPPLVAALSLVGRARGRATNPQFTGQGTLYGVESSGVSVKSLGASLTLRDGTLSADGIRGRVYGGALYGRAQVDLYRGDLRRMRPEPLIYAQGGVNGLDLEPATGGRVEALVGGTFLVRGTPAFLLGRVQARSPVLWAAGQWYRDAALDLGFRGPRYDLASLGVRREDGGHALVSGRFNTGPRGKVDLKIDVSRLPLAALPGLDKHEGPGPPPVSGEIETRGLRVLGTFAEPVLEGTVRLLAAAIRGVPAGNGELVLRPGGRHTALSGDLLSFLRVVTGRLDLGPSKGVALRLRFTEVPVEKFVPELAAQGNAEGRVSGTLDLEVGAPGGIRVAKLTVDKLSLRLEKPEDPFDDLPGEVAEIRNRGPIVMRYDHGRLVVDRCMLTDRADINRLVISGSLGSEDSRLRIRGRVNLLPAEILLAKSLRRLRGVLGVDLTVSGSVANPTVVGALYPAGLLVRAQQLGGDLVVRAGRVNLVKGALVLQGLRLQVVDDEAEVSGRVGLRGLRPETLDLTIKGDLSPRALELALGDTVVRPKGESSRLDLRVVGTVSEPQILGSINIGRMQMGLKSASQELTLHSGRVELREGGVKIHDVRGKLDEGAFTLTGDVFLRGFALDGLDLHFVGENIPHRSGGVYEVEVSPDVRLTGRGDPASGYTLAGVIDVVEGRYIQKFNVNPMSRFLSPMRTVESSGPFYEGSPLLENLLLNLTITTSGSLRVKNNIADVGLEGDLTVTGTLPSMSIGGTVDIKEGTFRVPYLRGRYSNASGSIDFDRGRGRGRGEGKDEPYVHLEGTMVHTDRSETDHEITLIIQGYLSKLVPTWSSNTGLNSSQTITLLVTSRTPDELRKGRSAALPNLAPLIEDYIPIDLQLDLSSDAVQVFVERKLGRYFRLKGEGEFGYQGSQRQEGVIVFRVTDNFSLEGRVKRRVQGEDVTEEDDAVSGRVEAKYKIQLSGGLRRSLGF